MQYLWKLLRNKALVSLVTVSIAASVVLGSGVAGYPQADNQSLTSRRAATVEIKEYAARHVETDSPLQTQTVIEIFKDNQAGLTTREVSKVYESEYIRLKKAKNSGFWSRVKPQAGWVASGILLVAVIFRNTFSKWLTRVVEAVGEGVYSRVAGNRLFQGIALQRYRKALLKKHKELHIPFRAGRPLDMEEVYIPLQVEGGSGLEQVDAYSAIARYKRIVVTGPPGGGKSMLLKHIALAYGTSRLDLPNRPIPIIIELHRLSDPNLTLKALIQAIVDAFGLDDFPKAERFTKQSLKGTLMLLLDGLDEVGSSVRPKVVQVIKDLLDTYDECRVIITCRTAVYRNEFDSVAEQTLKVSEFSDQQIRRFLKSWEQEMPAEKSIEQLLQTLRDRPRIVELARNPLLLTIIAHLYSNPSFVLPYSRAEFYQTSISILLEQWDQFRGSFNSHKSINKRRVLQHLALFSQTAVQRQQQDRRRMDHYAVLKEIQKILPDLNLDPTDNTEFILREIVERSGLLLAVDGGEGYKFSHLTLQEYFAAEAFKDNSAGLVDRFRQAPDEWREVVKLWCGFGGNSTALIQAVYSIDAITGFECLADAQEVAPDVADNIINAFKHRLGTVGQQEQITSAFGAVAADSRPRGKAVLNFLAEGLGNSKETPRRRAIAEALSKTNLPQAAVALGKYYDALTETRTALVRMGDLAVDVLSSLDESCTQAEDLFAIGTPGAAQVLSHQLQMGTPYMQAKRAWYLGALLPKPDIEDALRSAAKRYTVYDILNSPKSSNSLDWIWRPFQQSAGTPLADKISLISHLILTDHAKVVPVPRPALDSRLVVPLCTIYLRDQVKLPKTWPPEAETLIEQQIQTAEISEQMVSMVGSLLKENPLNSQWRMMLSELPPNLQLDLIRRLIVYPAPTQRHWQDIFIQSNYYFRKGWQYRCILCITAISSILAVIEMFIIAAQSSNNSLVLIVSSAFFVVLIFWAALRKGIDSAFEPSTFLRLGAFGFRTYVSEFNQLYQNHSVWPGIKLLYESLTVTGAGAITIAGITAFAVAFTISDAPTDTGIFAIALFISAAATVTFSNAIVGAVSVASTIAVTTVSIGSFIVVAAAVVASVGLRVLSLWPAIEEKERWLKFIALLALPWFCGLPIIVAFATLFLIDIFSFTWTQAISTDIFIIGLCSGLWWHGQQMELKARNPLQGGILQRELEANRSYLSS